MTMATIREAVSALVRDLTNCADITCHGERSLVAEVTALIENEIRAEREACAMDCESISESGDAPIAAQRDALLGTTAALVAAIDLLKHGGKKAAPSDKMFRQMLRDYEAYADKAREVLNMTDNA